MTAASLPADLRPRLGELVVCLGSDREAEVVAAAREITHALTAAGFDLGTLAAIIANEHEPILLPSMKSGRARRSEPVSARIRLADRLARLASNPRVDLDKWSHNFIVSAVATLRADLPLSERQGAVVERLLKVRGRRRR